MSRELLELADRVEALDGITCPLCGETGFDVMGYLYSHRNGRYCPVELAAAGIFPKHSNVDVAAALRARAGE